jgi:hypothetical protein
MVVEGGGGERGSTFTGELALDETFLCLAISGQEGGCAEVTVLCVYSVVVNTIM